MNFVSYETTEGKINSLEQWLLVHGYMYYKLNKTVMSDFVYDSNAKQLYDLIINNPTEFKTSRYYHIFYDWANDGFSSTTEYLLGRLGSKDMDNRIVRDAIDIADKYGR